MAQSICMEDQEALPVELGGDHRALRVAFGLLGRGRDVTSLSVLNRRKKVLG